MEHQLKIALWNANGLTQHKLEVQFFFEQNGIDVMLISETHFINKSYFKIHNYITYNTKHPDEKPHGGTAILVRNRIKHSELQRYNQEHIQATSIKIDEWAGDLVLSAVYCPLKHAIKKHQFVSYFKTLGGKFLAGGDFNSKHTHWGSRLISSKGKQLYEAMQKKHLDCLSSGQPTYWPTDRRKIPDLIDFCIIKGISRQHAQPKPCFNLSSDHSPIIITMCAQPRRVTTAKNHRFV